MDAASIANDGMIASAMSELNGCPTRVPTPIARDTAVVAAHVHHDAEVRTGGSISGGVTGTGATGDGVGWVISSPGGGMPRVRRGGRRGGFPQPQGL